MSQVDGVADMLTRLRNASAARHDHVEIPASRLKVEIAKVLRNEGFIKNYRVLINNRQNTLKIRLKYGPSKEHIINGVKMISQPGQRIYVGREKVPRVMGGLGVAILTTSRGVITDKQARKLGLGGEVICHIW